MAYSLEVKYYNTFWLKNVTTPLLKTGSSSTGEVLDVFPSVYPGNPNLNREKNNWINYTGEIQQDPYSNAYEISNNSWSAQDVSNWVIEESRIRGGFNNASVDFGVRAYLM